MNGNRSSDGRAPAASLCGGDLGQGLAITPNGAAPTDKTTRLFGCLMTASGNYPGTANLTVAASMVDDQHIDNKTAGIISNTNIQTLLVSGASGANRILLWIGGGAGSSARLRTGMMSPTVWPLL
jgi:hypothetical protein